MAIRSSLVDERDRRPRSPSPRTILVPGIRRLALALALVPQLLVTALGQSLVVCVEPGGHVQLEVLASECCEAATPSPEARVGAVVLPSYVMQRRSEGLGRREAAREAVTRLRPVLMTAMDAALGFVPMALGTSAGAEVQRPLATVVIGGLVTSTLLTLLVLPTMFPWFARTSRRTATDRT